MLGTLDCALKAVNLPLGFVACFRIRSFCYSVPNNSSTFSFSC